MAHCSPFADTLVTDSCPEKEVIILGGGLAGLAAAVVLAEENFQVTVVERRPFLGGRASSYPIPPSQQARIGAAPGNNNLEQDGMSTIDPTGPDAPNDRESYVDNCQHILLKCCTNLLDFYRRLGVGQWITFFESFTFLDPEGKPAILKGSRWPAPFHLMPSFFSFHPLGWREKVWVAYALWCMLRERRQLHTLDPMTMHDWLRSHRQSSRAIDAFWRPVLVSALNEEIERASARYGIKVFLDGFLDHAQAFHMGVPRVPLSRLYTEPCLAYLQEKNCRVAMRHTVVGIDVEHSKVTGIRLSNGSRLEGDYYLSTVPPEVLVNLLPVSLTAKSEYFGLLRRFESSPITSICLWFDRPITELEHTAILGHEIQWLFRRKDLNREGTANHSEYVALVISASRNLLGLGPQDIVRRALDDLRIVLPASAQASLLHSVVLKEPFATFSCKAGCDAYRLDQKSPLENFFVAGDWTKTDWPPTMEGAVRSSYRSAELILEAEGISRKCLIPDLPANAISRWFSGR
ncbi:MAG: hydroxysqualene dehydroxylase HpnE [Terriglobia bacterium]